MNTVFEKIRKVWPNPMTGELRARQRKRVISAFPMLRDCDHDAFLALDKYASSIPEQCYSLQAFNDLTELLERELVSDRSRLTNLLSDSCEGINGAFVSLEEISRQNWHDTLMETEDHAFMRNGRI